MRLGREEWKADERGSCTWAKDFDYKTTDRPTNEVDYYIVYLHFVHRSSPGYESGLASAMVLQPEMEGRIDFAVKNAYKKRPKRKSSFTIV